MGSLRRKTYLYRRFATAGAVLAAALAGAGCEDLTARPQRPPTIELRDVTLLQYGSDGLAGTGTAEVVQFRRDSGQLAGRTLVVQVPPSPKVGRDGITIAAAEGQGDVRGRTARLSGGVTVLTGEGDRAHSETATYAAADDAVRGDGQLTAAGPGYELSGTRWVAHVGQRRIDLASGVTLRTAEAP